VKSWSKYEHGYSRVKYTGSSLYYQQLIRLYSMKFITFIFQHWMGDQKIIISNSSVLRKARKPLVLATFAVVSTNPHWACVVCYGPFSLCVIHKKSLCPSSGHINRLMMMMKISKAIALISNCKCLMCCWPYICMQFIIIWTWIYSNNNFTCHGVSVL
jgi:hypothetical protein